MRIGVIGYSAQSFDEDKARKLLKEAINNELKRYGLSRHDIEIVSGLSNIGIPKIAYEIAKDNTIKTVGIAPREVFNYDLFPVDEQMIVGKTFGEESEYFLNYIDMLIKCGGGKQSEREAQMAEVMGKPIVNINL